MSTSKQDRFIVNIVLEDDEISMDVFDMLTMRKVAISKSDLPKVITGNMAILTGVIKTLRTSFRRVAKKETDTLKSN